MRGRGEGRSAKRSRAWARARWVVLAGFAISQVAACFAPECADDVAGNEVLVWEHVPDADYYEIGVEDAMFTIRTCARTDVVRSLAGFPFREQTFYGICPGRCAPPVGVASLHVRACESGGTCGPWSNAVDVESQSWRCFEADGEVPCWGI